MNIKINTTLAIGIIMIAAMLSALIIVIGASDVFNETIKNDIVACTQEAKLCPDGSSVTRIFPSCSFAPCPRTEQIAGGDCEYEKTRGICGIKAVMPDGNIKFSFTPEIPLVDDFSIRMLDREQSGPLDELLPDPKQQLKTGDSIKCTASVIKKGTCTPVIFEFLPSVSSSPMQ